PRGHHHTRPGSCGPAFGPGGRRDFVGNHPTSPDIPVVRFADEDPVRDLNDGCACPPFWSASYTAPLGADVGRRAWDRRLTNSRSPDDVDSVPVLASVVRDYSLSP